MVPARFQIPSVTKGLLGAAVLVLLQLTFPTPRASAALQSNVEAPQQASAAVSAAFGQSLRPALEQVGSAIAQIHIDHWKVSKAWKAQLQNDASSIAQDLSNTLPGLLQQANASPTALDVQLRAMQNVDALYDVLVRLTLAADLTEKKSDATMLDSALQQLETARKSATAQMVRTAAVENLQLIQMRTRLEDTSNGEHVAGHHARTIVVDNDARHGTTRHATHHRKSAHAAANAKTESKASQPSAQKTAPQH